MKSFSDRAGKKVGVGDLVVYPRTGARANGGGGYLSLGLEYGKVLKIKPGTVKRYIGYKQGVSDDYGYVHDPCTHLLVAGTNG
jgi:hypothetical protein